jgi:hypothetical protein
MDEEETMIRWTADDVPSAGHTTLRELRGRPHTRRERPRARGGLRARIVVWTVAYVAIAWTVLKLVRLLGDVWSWTGLDQVASLVLALVVLPALVLAGQRGEAETEGIGSLEAALMAATIMGAAFAVWSICFTLVTT